MNGMIQNPIEVLITLPFNDDLLNRLRSVSSRLHFTIQKASKREEIADEIWAKTEILYTNTVLPVPEKTPKLRWVQLHWAGVDHVIDHPLLKKKDLILTHLSGANASQMAEFAVMMLLALGHNFPTLRAYQLRGEWPVGRWNQFQPVELRGSTVGIVGYGSIARQTARLLHSFGARVLATKRDVLHPEDTGYIQEGMGDANADFVHRMYPPQALRSMLKESSFLLVTIPLTRETCGMIGAAELASLPKGAYLVDISRGSVVEHQALLESLRSGHLGGAALDVFPTEPLPADSPLWTLPNVILTPHISGFSPAYDWRAVELFGDNLTRYLNNLPLYNRINPELGY
jgi:phosphoglycerate dehydrogenase-like enzyme